MPDNKEYYLNDIKVLDWMTNDKYQILRFKDRLEYRKDGRLNRIDGPAVEYFSDKDNLYYFEGKKLTLDEFKIISKTEKIKQV